MTLHHWLLESAEALQQGDHFQAERLESLLHHAREQLDDLIEEWENQPQPEGLEGLDESLAEAFENLFEALDLLELAVKEDVPELAPAIQTRTLDAMDILRDVETTALSHYQMLEEEAGLES